jgi:prevent-host-death family protein
MQVRELRANLAAALRRAEAGERVVITAGGRPVAQLGPIEATTAPTLDDLAAAGLVVRARRADHPDGDVVLALPVGARLDRLFDEIRG